jgi:hypothetical protein
LPVALAQAYLFSMPSMTLRMKTCDEGLELAAWALEASAFFDRRIWPSLHPREIQ